MKLFCFLLFIFTGHVHGSSDDRIVGGNPARTNIRYQVSLQTSSNVHICGGALLNKNWIVTSATCVRLGPTIVGYGSNSMRELRKCPLDLNRRLIHPSNTGAPYTYDVGMVRTDCNLVAGPTISYVRLPFDNIPVDSALNVTGWGWLANPGPFPDKLQLLTSRTISANDCSGMIGMVIPSSAICTLTKIGEGICYFDIGGPLVDNTKGQAVLYGIVSGAPAYCARAYPDLHARVADLGILTWLNNIMRT